MRFYRNHYSVEGGNSGGYSWHMNKTSALVAARGEDEEPHAVAEVILIGREKLAVLRALNRYANHPNNG